MDIIDTTIDTIDTTIDTIDTIGTGTLFVCRAIERGVCDMNVIYM